ncbi:MAG: hypothetical protein CR981_00745 [Proteobacteria bacterium]|nr:MAG: hypothetical protein CR981_00745 [Pseudomonadota bacterium]
MRTTTDHLSFDNLFYACCQERDDSGFVEADLQEQFEISRSPLRETFRELKKKKLVEIAGKPFSGQSPERISGNIFPLMPNGIFWRQA